MPLLDFNQSATSENIAENAAVAVVEAKSAVTPVVISPVDCRLQCKMYCGPGLLCCGGECVKGGRCVFIPNGKNLNRSSKYEAIASSKLCL